MWYRMHVIFYVKQRKDTWLKMSSFYGQRFQPCRKTATPFNDKNINLGRVTWLDFCGKNLDCIPFFVPKIAKKQMLTKIIGNIFA